MNKQQGVLMLLENNPYPHDSRVQHEAQTLLRAGYAITVISPSAKGLPFYEIVDGVTVYRYLAPPEISGFLGYIFEYGYSLIAMFLLTLIVSLRDGFAIIHAHNPPDLMVLIAIFFKPFGKQFVFDHHDIAPEMYTSRGGNARVRQVLLFFERLSCRFADYVIVTNESYKQLDIKRNNVPESQIAIVRNGPSLEILKATEPDTTLRQRASYIIGYLGEIGLNDGGDYLIHALRSLYEIRQDWYCIIIGDGPAKSAAEQLMLQSGLSDFVNFVGWKTREEFLPLLAAVDIGIEPIPRNDYTNRSTMIKIMEYMALSLPIVAFDLAEHRATAQDCVLYAKPNDVTDFAHCIAQLMDNREQRVMLGAMGRARVASHLVWTRQEENLRAVYDVLTTTR